MLSRDSFRHAHAPRLDDQLAQFVGIERREPGLSNSAIASKLGVATKTVSNNVSAIFAELQVADRAQAIIRARDAGLGRPPTDERSSPPS